MYKAIKEIGGYKIGEEVPKEIAETWLKMYSIPHVEEVSEEDEKSIENVEEVKSEPEKKKESEHEEKSSNNVMLDDYLGRNTNVVKKNIEEDSLSKKQLEGLLELEKSGKKRRKVISAIKFKLKE